MSIFKRKSEVERLAELQAKIERQKLIQSLRKKVVVEQPKMYRGRLYDTSGLVGNKIKTHKHKDS